MPQENYFHYLHFVRTQRIQPVIRNSAVLIQNRRGELLSNVMWRKYFTWLYF